MKFTYIKKIFTRKNLVRFAFCLLAFVTVTMVYFRIDTWRAKKAWDDYYAQSIAKGVKFDLESFQEPEIPDEINYAANPFFTEPDIKDMLPSLRRNGFKFPPINILAKHEQFNATAWRDYLHNIKIIKETTDNPAFDITSTLDQLAGLKHIRAAYSKPDCLYPLDLTNEDVFPYTFALRCTSISKYLSISSHARLNNKDYAGAHNDCLQLLRLGASLNKETTLFYLIQMQNILGESNIAMRDLLATGQLTEEQLKQLEEKLLQLNIKQSAINSIKVERAFAITYLPQMYAPSMKDERNETFLGYNKNLKYIIPKSWLYSEMLVSSKLYDQILARAEDSANAEKSKDFNEKYIDGNSIQMLRYPLSHFLRSNLHNRVVICCYAQVSLAQAAIELERIRLRDGKYPDTYTDTIDPADGKLLRYRLTADGYELWSVGEDRIDQNGKHDANMRRVNSQPDLLWQLSTRPTMMPEK